MFQYYFVKMLRSCFTFYCL